LTAAPEEHEYEFMFVNGRRPARGRRTPPPVLKGERLPAAPLQARSETRRARLKAAALEVFASAGYERSSVGSICGRAGLPVGTFYQHFRSKRQLLLVLMQELLDRLSTLEFRFENARRAQPAVAAMLRGALLVEFEYLGAHRAWREAALSDPEIAAKQRSIRRWTTSRVLGLLRGLQRLPGARPRVDVESLAPVLDELFWTLLFQVPKGATRQVARTTGAVAELVCRAVLADRATARR
jgi:AcrR family transcriptional regulator